MIYWLAEILEQAGYIHRVKAVKGQHTYNCYFLLQPDNSLEEILGNDSLVDDSDVFVSTTAQRELPYPPNHSSDRPLAAATLAQRDPNGGSERTNNIRNNPSSEILILIDAKEDIISSATPRTLASSDRSKEETTTEKTEPRKLGEVRFEDMFWVKDQEQSEPIGNL